MQVGRIDGHLLRLAELLVLARERGEQLFVVSHERTLFSTAQTGKIPEGMRTDRSRGAASSPLSRGLRYAESRAWSY